VQLLICSTVFALLSPGNILANLVGGALSEAGAMQAGELMQDYKTGHLLHASPRAQFIGQLVGSSAGVVISTVSRLSAATALRGSSLYPHSWHTSSTSARMSSQVQTCPRRPRVSGSTLRASSTPAPCRATSRAS
jgi:hypothetical protein